LRNRGVDLEILSWNPCNGEVVEHFVLFGLSFAHCALFHAYTYFFAYFLAYVSSILLFLPRLSMLPREALRHHDAHGPPIGSVNFVRFRHPGNDANFLSLPAYDPTDATHPQYGIHLRTALTACQIIAYNKPGYFTERRQRTAPSITYSMDDVIPARTYYYHLESQGSSPMYPICRDFRRWRFEHDAFPSAWVSNSPASDIIHCNWTALSQKVKSRDAKCLVSGERDSLNTAHIVPKAEVEWVSEVSHRCSVSNLLLATL
jgi:hypothetical protein